MFKRRIIIGLAILLPLFAILLLLGSFINWNREWAERETSKAFSDRFHGIPRRTIHHQYQRGVVCGAYQFPSHQEERFIYVSYYSSHKDPLGLFIPSDAGFEALAAKLCRNIN